MNEQIMKACELCGISFNKKYNHQCDNNVLYSRAKQQYDEKQKEAEYNAIHEGETF